MLRGTGRGEGGPQKERRVGYFRCKSCETTWKSSHVYCKPGTEIVLFQQDCKDCKVGCFPYRTEPYQCSKCGQTCTCTEEELEETNTNPNRREEDGEGGEGGV